MKRKQGARRSSLCGGIILALCIAGHAQAQDCGGLKRAASIQMKPIYGGYAMLVPVSIEGTQRHLLFDTGGYMSQITAAVADELKMEPRKSSLQLFDVSGNKSDSYVIAKKVEIGGMQAINLPFIVINPNSNFGGGSEPMDGILSSDLLFKYDIEVDYGSNTLNYFLPDHCEGRVIYWPNSGVGVVPVRVFNNQIRVTVELDGKKIDALVDTGASRTTISLNTAKYRFGITPDSPDVEKDGPVNGDETLQSYRRKFSRLSFGDIAVANLNIALLPDKVNSKNGHEMQTEWRAKRVDEDLTLEPMLIGMDVLRHMRIYMAFKEKRFYVTAIGAPPQGAPAGPAAQANPGAEGPRP